MLCFGCLRAHLAHLGDDGQGVQKAQKAERARELGFGARKHQRDGPLREPVPEHPARLAKLGELRVGHVSTRGARGARPLAELAVRQKHLLQERTHTHPPADASDWSVVRIYPHGVRLIGPL
eukprot:625690-Prorocentrum_minimum.AAC.1